MIVVTDIKTIETKDDCFRIAKFINKAYWVPPEDAPLKTNVEYEYITGEFFVNEGVKYHLGLSKRAEEILRLPMKCFGELTSEVNALRRISDKTGADNILLEQRLDDFVNASLWQRIKYLFTGNL